MVAADEEQLLTIAREAAEAAAAELRSRFGKRAAGVRAKSTPTDLVSDADLAAEAVIREVLGTRRPQDAIVGEEGGASEAAKSAGRTGKDAEAGRLGDGLRWVVDPLDGTINYLFGIPMFAVSIACEDSSGGVAGIVLDPVRQESFTATRSGEALRNGAPILAADRVDLAAALVATGFSYDAGVRARQAEVLRRVLPLVRDIRRAGAAALDLCWCACGRYDAYYERGLHTWDRAAGELIARRAGLAVRELPAEGDDPAGVVVAAPALVDRLYGLVVDHG